MKFKRGLTFLLMIVAFSIYASGIYAEQKIEARVDFIDVGQGDSIFIQAGGKSILIDAGSAKDAKEVIAYLKDCKVKKLDVFIGTHPHADHIGGASEVLKQVGATKIYMPKVSNNTKTFEKLLVTIKNQNMKITAPKTGDFIIDEDSVTLQVLAPSSSTYEEINEYSIVTKLTVGKNTFLFMGDAESVSEKELMNGDISLKADVLKVGHHGGETSTSSSFLKKVMPSYGVITVGKDNSYNHPNKETLKRLGKIKIYRTDKQGNILFTTDGTKIQVRTEK